MKRYRIGDIQPEWRSPPPPSPTIVDASDRAGFGVLARGQLSVYRLGFAVLGSAAAVEGIRNVALADSTKYALGPGARLLAVAMGTNIELSDQHEAPIGTVTTPGDVDAVAISASGKTLWAAVSRPGSNPAEIHAWALPALAPLGNVEAFAYPNAVYELVTHPDPSKERLGVDAAAGQEGSSFTFVECQDDKLTLLPGSHDGPDGVGLGGLAEDGALLISREAIVLIDVTTGDRLHGPARAQLNWMRDEMIFDYQRGYLDGFWILSGRYDDRDPDDAESWALEDVPEGRLRVYDSKLQEVLEMPSTDDPFDTLWSVLGLVKQRVLICQADAVMLYNLRPVLGLGTS